MADEEPSDIVSVLSSPSEPSTLPSTVLQEGSDSPMEDKDGDAISSEEEGDCLSNHPASSHTGPTKEAMSTANGEVSSALPPQGVDPQDASSLSHSSKTPIKRRPGTKASAGRAQSKKLRQTVGQVSKQPLGSIPEHGQQPVTLADLANMTAHMQAVHHQQAGQPPRPNMSLEEGSRKRTPWHLLWEHPRRGEYCLHGGLTPY